MAFNVNKLTNSDIGRSKKWKHGSVSVALTAAVVAAVVILNVIITLLTDKCGLSLRFDLTSEGLFSVTKECETLLSGTFDDFNVDAAAFNPTVGGINETTVYQNDAVINKLVTAETVALIETLKEDYYDSYADIFDFFTGGTESQAAQYYRQYLEEFSAADELYLDRTGKTLATGNLSDRANANMVSYNDAVGDFNRKITTINNYIAALNRIIKKANAVNAANNEPLYDAVTKLNKLTAFQDTKVQIIFCDTADNLIDNYYANIVYQTALNLEKAFPEYIEVVCVDIYLNPSAVQKYKATSGATINTSDVIVTSGTEFRLYGLRSFFVFESDSDSTPWAYNGEKYLSTGILAVTRADAPVCGLTTNHNETIYDYELLYSLTYGAGFQIAYIDLLEDEIPEDCRLIISFNPQTDFISYFDDNSVTDGVSECEKLDRFLDEGNSFLLFIDAYTPKLTNLEEYMEEWGITVNRAAVGDDEYNQLVKDPASSLTSNGATIVADYVTTGMASGMLSTMLEQSSPAKVVFKNATSLGVSGMYNLTYVDEEDLDDDEETFAYYSYNGNGVSRLRHNIFTAGSGAYTEAAGEKVDTAGSYTLMAVTYEYDSQATDSFGNVITNNHYFGVVASTDFASEEFLQSATFGNTDVLLSVLRTMGRENVAVGLDLKPFADTTIDSITTARMTRDTLLLVLIPAFVCLAAGTVIMVRRKNT